jgi:endonuclease G
MPATNPVFAFESDPTRSGAIEKAISAGKNLLRAGLMPDRDGVDRVTMRKSLLYPNDRFGYERVIGVRDIVQITFLRQALEAGRSVCRLRIRGETPAPASFGTGFLVAPGVLLTNHHVLEAPETAQLSLAEFGAELDLNYVVQPAHVFNLLPEKLFVTDPELDFTFVAVNSTANDGTPLSEFRWLTLLRDSGKALNGEWVTIIQHPGGQTKQIVIRNNRVIFLPKKDLERIGTSFIHYTSDTERGSSGSPVLNDQFEVVALHHKSVPKYNRHGDIVARDKKVWKPEMGEDQIAWIANEGVRISELFNRLDRLRHGDPQAVTLLTLMEGGQPGSVFSSLSGHRAAQVEEVGDGPALEKTALARRKGKGYQADFLGFPVPLPKPNQKLAKFVQPLEPNGLPKGSVKGELVYTHFSVVMHRDRKLAIFAAVNIDGSKPLKKPTVTPRWRLDNRVSLAIQSGSELYLNNPLDKGHLVRRLDPAWGGKQQEVDDAVTDTYHYANAAPQEHSFNDGLWGDLEDYILQLAAEKNRKISVFTGPVFGEHDRKYGESRSGGPWFIPAQFWKVIVYRKQTAQGRPPDFYSTKAMRSRT